MKSHTGIVKVVKAEDTADWYLRNPTVRALAQFIPGGVGGAIDVYVATRYERLKDARRRAFFDELDSGDRQLSPDVMESDDFLHCFDITLRAVHRTHRHAKIKLFARLLKSSVSYDSIADIDRYEELLRIIEELSIRDFKVLLAFEEYESLYYKDGHFVDDKSHEGVFQGIAAKYLGIPVAELSDNELRGIVVRLNRTGCYALMGWRKGPAKDCGLTGIYYRLRKHIQDKGGDILPHDEASVAK